MEATRGAIGFRDERSTRTRAAIVIVAASATIVTSFVLGRVTTPAEEAPALAPAPIHVVQPAEHSPLRPHMRHHQVKGLGGGQSGS
jgi:hypothetical protein